MRDLPTDMRLVLIAVTATLIAVVVAVALLAPEILR
jgi:hypothetical protein